MTSIETSIGNNAFNYCQSLSSISVAEDNPVFDSRNNCNAIIETSSNSLLIGCNSTVIPEDVTSISPMAFLGSGLEEITIPDNVTEIGDWAFLKCSRLKEITLSESLTSIGNWVFGECSGLKAITIPEGVTSISSEAFSDCRNLTSVIIPGTVKNIGWDAFSGCSSQLHVYCVATTPPAAYASTFDDDLIEATLHVYASALDDYENTEPWNRFGNIVPLTQEEIATAVRDVNEKSHEERAAAIYDLNGLRHSSMQRGLYIVNGKKVVVK